MGFKTKDGKILSVNKFVASPEQIQNEIKKLINDGTVSINGDSEIDEIKKAYPQCKNYKGVFAYPTSATYWRDTAQKGDFYIQGFSTTMSYHRHVFDPGDIMYFNGEKLEQIKPLKQNKVLNTIQHYDVCIIGGGAGGVGCAYALKDSGLKVCIIEKQSQLGGTHVSAGMGSLMASPVNGTWFNDILQDGYKNKYMVFARNSGDLQHTGDTSLSEYERLRLNSLYNGSASGITQGNIIRIDYYRLSQKYYNDLIDTIDIKLNTEFIESACNLNNEIISIKIKDNTNGNESYIYAKYFVDCSADGVLCKYRKTEGENFFIGTDAKSKYNESAISDNVVASKYDINPFELLYCVPGKSYKQGDYGDEFTEDYSKYKKFSDITSGGVNGVFSSVGDSHLRIISPGKYLNLSSKLLIDLGQDLAYGEAYDRAKYHFTKSGYNCNGSAHGGFGGCFPMLAIRESYRIKCDRMMTQTDVETRATASNYATNHTIALSSWYCDIHNANGIGEVNSSWLIGIPYESLIPSAFKNVLIGSRCFGASHLALSACRLTKTMMSLGYVCGKAMQLANDGAINDVRNIDITTLQINVGILDLITEIDTYFPQS